MRAGLRAREAGVSLIELMVAATLGTVLTLVMMNTVVTTEQIRRALGASGDATYNGILAAAVLEREIRGAGYRVSHPLLMGCDTWFYDRTAPSRGPLTFVLGVLLIADGAGGAPDTITVVYGDGEASPSGAKTVAKMVANYAQFRVDNPFGIRAGDRLIVAQAGQPCTFMESTSTPIDAPAGARDVVTRVAGSYVDDDNVSRPSRYNNTRGLGPVYGAGAQVFSLGRVPKRNVYSLANDKLVVSDFFANETASVIADNVVQFQAQYGLDTDYDGSVNSWSAATPAGDLVRQIIAVRYMFVVRSTHPERPTTPSAACTTTASNTVNWAGGAVRIDTTPEWACYRYRDFSNVISLRNLIWTPQ